MADKLIISVSGMRGVVGRTLTAADAVNYGCAFGMFLQNRHRQGKMQVCIGRDSRPSGAMLASAVAAGLCSVGVDVVQLGIVTTPGVGIMLRELGCAGGVVITASHNPIEYNGIKLLLEKGMAPSPEQAAKIKEMYKAGNFASADSVHCGSLESDPNSNSIHLKNVLRVVEAEAIRARKFRVVVDSVNGAGGPVTRQFLEGLGCSVVAMNDEPTGLFAHTPEPLKENLTGLCERVKQVGADVGFAQDPDADRLAVVNERGEYIGEEYTLALAAKYVLGKQRGKAAANLSTSRMVDDVAAEFGCEVIRTPVGEANVAKAMIENGCVIGGEGNGGVIDLRVGGIRDSLVGIGFVLGLLAQTGKKVSEVVEEIGSYNMRKSKLVADPDQANRIIDAATHEFSDAKVNSSDGCRFDMPDGWVHLRSSNTEPVMRVIIETCDENAQQKYSEIIEQIRRQVLE